MGPILITNTNHRLRRFGDQEFWAERGIINIVDSRTGEHKTNSCREFKAKIEALYLQSKRPDYADIRATLRRVVLDMVDVLEEAINQGDPQAPGVMKDMGHEKRYIGAIVPELPVVDGEAPALVPDKAAKAVKKLILPPGV